MFALAMQSSVLSSFLLVVAGILVGYALSYPYRGESEGLNDEIDSLRNENRNLHESLREQKRVRDEHPVPAVKQPSAVIDHEVVELLEDAVEEAETLRSELAKTNQQLTEATGLNAELRGELDELKLVQQQESNETEDGNRRLQLTIESLTQRIYELEEENTGFASTLETERMQFAQAGQIVHRGSAAANNEHQQAFEELQHELSSTQKSLEQTTANLQRAVSERDEIAERYSAQESQISALARDRDDHLRAIETIERLRNGSDTTVVQYQEHAQELESRLAQAEVLLDQANEELELHQQSRIKADQEHESTIAELDHHRQRSLQLESEVSRLQHNTDRIRSQREEVLASLRIEQDRSAQLEINFEQTKQILQDRELQLQRSGEQLRSIQPATEEMESLQFRVDVAHEELQQVKSDYHEALQSKARIEAIVVEMREELRKNSQLISDSRTARNERAEQLSRELENERRTVAELRPTISELQTQLAQQEERMNSNGQHEFEMTTIYTQLAEARSQIDRLNREASDLREELARRVDMVAHLEQERNEVLSINQQLQRQAVEHSRVQTPASYDDGVEIAEAQFAEHISRQTADAMRNDDRRGMIYTRPPAVRDDLKRISGVAEKLEQRLNDFGVYTYEQIMHWDDEIVAEFGRLLAFKDRIVRDDWVSQARMLYNEAYPQSQKRSA